MSAAGLTTMFVVPDLSAGFAGVVGAVVGGVVAGSTAFAAARLVCFASFTFPALRRSFMICAMRSIHRLRTEPHLAIEEADVVDGVLGDVAL